MEVQPRQTLRSFTACSVTIVNGCEVRNSKVMDTRVKSVETILSECIVWAYYAILFNYMSTYWFSDRMPTSGHSMDVAFLLSN